MMELHSRMPSPFAGSYTYEHVRHSYRPVSLIMKTSASRSRFISRCLSVRPSSGGGVLAGEAAVSGSARMCRGANRRALAPTREPSCTPLAPASNKAAASSDADFTILLSGRIEKVAPKAQSFLSAIAVRPLDDELQRSRDTGRQRGAKR